MGGMSIWHWLIVLVIVLLVFGSKKLGNVGSDLGRAMRDFKKGLGGDDDDDAAQGAKPDPQLRASEDVSTPDNDSTKASHQDDKAR